MNYLSKELRAQEFWKISGDFGKLTGEVQQNGNEYITENEAVRVTAKIIKDKTGIIQRKDAVENISNRPVTLYTLFSRFVMHGGEYGVYTQYNGWCDESDGAWQKLVTSVGAKSESVRSANNATPFMALWNEQTQRGVAFHLLPNSAWEIQTSRFYISGEAAAVEVVLGVLRDGLRLTLAPGEIVELPEILYYEFQNKTDMDCWKLHTYLHKTYPRKEMPIIYNSWLYKFDRFTYEDIEMQVEKAAELGVEYFVIDAGWFGNGQRWIKCRGDWEEALSSGFCGRMNEISQMVRDEGMKFGFWIEAESATASTKIVAEHPEYFLEENGNYFLNFAREDAREHIYNTLCALIERYHAAFIKFDFNADLKFDPEGTAFIPYFVGYGKFIEKLRNQYPGLYMENCGSGGIRMSIRDGIQFDSFWLSDNQSPYESLRIFKDTMLRMPPQWIECWSAITTWEKFQPQYWNLDGADKIISSNDATWNDIVGVHESFLQGVMTGGPIGLSFDLTSLSDFVFAGLQDFFKRIKENRAFWQEAVCHILTDTETMLVLEFRNEDFSKVELVVFAKKTVQAGICVYPVVAPQCTYRLSDGTVKTSEQLDEESIDFAINERYSAQFMTLEKRTF